MRNLTIEQQKEFEKMMAEINRLHQENYDLIKSNKIKGGVINDWFNNGTTKRI